MDRQRALAAFGGLVAGLPTAGLAWRLLPPEPAHHSAIPLVLGGMVGAAAGAAVWSDGHPDRRSTLGHIVLAAAIVVCAVLGFVAVDSRVTSHFDVWVPWVSLAGVMVVVGAAVDELWRKRRRAVWTTLLVALAITASAVHSEAIVRVLQGERVRAWNLYHYQVGSKYFPELGYSDLYAATVVADDDWRARPESERTGVPDLGQVVRVRDMTTYRRAGRQQIADGFDRSRISPERLEQLGADVRELLPWLSPDTWKLVLIDLGYNPAPPWTIIGVPVGSLVPPHGPGLWAVANSDLPVLVALVGFLLWGFGLRPTAIGVLFLMTVPFNEDRLTGGLLQYDWLAAMGIALALWRRGWHVTAGLVLSWGAMTRVFPGFFMFPAFAALAWHAARRRPLPPATLRFVGAFVAASLVLFVASHATGRGAGTWPEWLDKIQMHSRMHVLTSDRRLGLKRLPTHDPKPDLPFDYHHGTVEEMLARVDARAPYYQGVALLLLLPILWRRRRLDAMLMMLYLVFIATVTSRYYASAWMFLPLLARPDDSREPAGMPGQIGAVGIVALPGIMNLCPDDRVAYYVANYYAWAMFAAICVAWMAHDVRRPGTSAGT